MKRLFFISALALLAAVTATLVQPRQWRFDAGVFHAFLATLTIIAALTANSVISRQRSAGRTGPFGPGLLTVGQTFWTTMAVNMAIGCLVLQLDSGEHGAENYAIGMGALLPHALALLAVLACLTFMLVRWWPLRLTLATASGCVAAFACMAISWWL
jgi:hypothetical protein